MPVIIKPDDMQTDSGDGWTRIVLADDHHMDTAAMVASRLTLEPNALGPEITQAADSEGMLYVIKGEGIAIVGGERLPLKTESMLWLEAGDTVQLEAGAGGLEILQGYAPGE